MPLLDIKVPPKDWENMPRSTLRNLARDGSKPAQDELARRAATVEKQAKPRLKHKTDWVVDDY